MQIACKFIHMLKIDCFARKNECTWELLAFHANDRLYGRILDISTKYQHQQSNSFQDSPILSICFEVLSDGEADVGDGEADVEQATKKWAASERRQWHC